MMLALSDTAKIVIPVILSSLCTAFGAFIVLMFGHVAHRLFIEPLQEQRKTVGRIAHAIHFYRNVGPKKALTNTITDTTYTSGCSPEQLDRGYEHLRGLASELQGNRRAIPFNEFWARWKVVPGDDAIRKASEYLRGYSVAITRDDGDKTGLSKQIADVLGIVWHG